MNRDPMRSYTVVRGEYGIWQVYNTRGEYGGFPVYLQSENFFVTFGRVGSSWFGMFQVPFYSNPTTEKKKKGGKENEDRMPAGYGMAW